MGIERIIKGFLEKHFLSKKPLLVGFSGGEDSLTLVHILMRLGTNFHLAHFDHGWRNSSFEEAKALGKWAEENKIPFHTKRSLSPCCTELDARNERIEFFKQLFEEGDFGALALAHHLNDQAETVLKRVFESPHLFNLKGMLPISFREGMPIYRPLLTVSKTDILDYIETFNLCPVKDLTNSDPKYLRARMRQNLVPLIEKSFGKNINSSLARVGNSSTLLDNYLDEKTSIFEPERGPFGLMWDLSSAHPLEIHHLLCRKLPIDLSNHMNEKIIFAIKEKLANHKIGHNLIVDRGCLFWIRSPMPRFLHEGPLQEGIITSGLWEWDIRFAKVNPKPHWKQLWKGKISLPLPQMNQVYLTPPDSTFRKKWNASKVPAFLRESLPMLVHNDMPIGEFLTGTSQRQSSASIEIQVRPRE